MSNFDIASVVFYVDEDLDSDQFVLPIVDDGFTVVRHRDIIELPAGTPDEVWIPFVARRGWFAFSHNREISYMASQAELVMRERLGFFNVKGQSKQQAHRLFAEKVIGAKTSIGNFVKHNYRPFIASVTGPQGKRQRYRVNGLQPRERVWGNGKMDARKQLRSTDWIPHAL